MSQLGMQMPGAARRVSASPNIYTGLLFVAVVALAAACGYVWVQGSKVGVDGAALGTEFQQVNQIRLKSN